MSNISKSNYALSVIEALAQSNQIVNDARNLSYVDFSSVYAEVLGELDYDDFRHHCIDIPVFTKDDKEDEAIEIITFENPFAYGSFFATDFDEINYDNYNFREEADFHKFLNDVITAIVVSHTGYNVTAETLDLEVTISEMYEENYGLKELLPAIFVSDCVSHELSKLSEHLKNLHEELGPQPYLIDTNLVYKPFDNSVFYESSKCW